MIRINLLGQARPKAARKAVPLEATLQFLLMGLALVFAVLVLWYHSYQMGQDLKREQERIKQLRAQKTDLERIKQDVDAFESQKRTLEQRVGVIEQLQKDRTGGQELLDMVATTVTRTDNLWLTTMTRKGNALTLEGAAASVNSVANFITQLKRSGFFQKIEITESKQDEKNAAVETFTFQLTAEIAPPPGKPVASPAAGSAPASRAAAPAKKG